MYIGNKVRLWYVNSYICIYSFVVARAFCRVERRVRSRITLLASWGKVSRGSGDTQRHSWSREVKKKSEMESFRYVTSKPMSLAVYFLSLSTLATFREHRSNFFIFLLFIYLFYCTFFYLEFIQGFSIFCLVSLLFCSFVSIVVVAFTYPQEEIARKRSRSCDRHNSDRSTLKKFLRKLTPRLLLEKALIFCNKKIK